MLTLIFALNWANSSVSTGASFIVCRMRSRWDWSGSAKALAHVTRDHVATMNCHRDQGGIDLCLAHDVKCRPSDAGRVNHDRDLPGPC